MQRVVIVGGTHGNELGGIYLHKLWQTPPAEWSQLPFSVESCLANPGATQACRRYLDQDLNRSFVPTDLNNPDLAAYEAQRAKVLSARLGGADFLFDLHNTTSNMGVTLILSRPDALDDPLTRQLCSHLAQDPEVRIYFNPSPPEHSPYLPSVAQRDITVEVGPMAHGTLNASLFFKTRETIEKALAFLADWHTDKSQPAEQGLTYYHHIENVDYPRSSEGDLAGMVHPHLQSRDFEPLNPGEPLFITFSGETIAYQGSETVWPVFINEQAYYEKHFAMSLARKVTQRL